MSSVNTISSKRRTVALIAAWSIVTIPAAWGVSQTIQKSLALFRSTQPALSAPHPAAPARDRATH
jgi:hypothetical protein